MASSVELRFPYLNEFFKYAISLNKILFLDGYSKSVVFAFSKEIK